jgi:hypothetical protein
MRPKESTEVYKYVQYAFYPPNQIQPTHKACPLISQLPESLDYIDYEDCLKGAVVFSLPN